VAPPDALESSDEGEYGEDAGGGSPGLTTTPTTSASTTSAATTSASTTGGEPTGSESGTVVEATGSTGTTGDTTGPSASCGDGIVDGEEGEQCDLGYANNSDVGGPCTQACELAYCGDGLVRVEEEQCDLGPDNNDAEYGGCREDCTLGPRCGDGVKQAAFKVTGLVGQVSPASDSEADLFGWRSVAHWTKFASLACSYKRHVYCFED